MKHTNFPNEVDHEEAPETWMIQAFWLLPGFLLLAFIIGHIIIAV